MASKRQSSFVKVRSKKLFFPFLLLLAVIVISLGLSDLQEIFALFARAKWIFLVLALFSQALNVAFQAKVYSSIMKYLHFTRFTFFRLYGMVITASFLNFSIPSLGSAGNIWLFRKFVKAGCDMSKSLLIIVWETLCYYGGLLAITIYSLAYIYFKVGGVSSAQKIAAAVFVGLIILVVFIFRSFFKNKRKAVKRIEWINSKIKIFAFKNTKHGTKRFLDTFYRDLAWLKQNKKKFVKPVSFQVFKFLSDGLTISLIFLAFGFNPTEHLALGLVAFTFGRLLGILSMVPGGIGFFEGAMTLLLGSFGVPLSTAITVTLVYRFYSYWLYFPFGLLFSKDWKKSGLLTNGKHGNRKSK